MENKTYLRLVNASTSDAQRLYREGMDLYFGITQRSDQDNAMERLQKSAEMGYVPAILRFNAYSGLGHRVESDRLLALGAEKGDPICAYIYAQACVEYRKKSDLYILELFDVAWQNGFNVIDQMTELIKKLPPDIKIVWQEKLKIDYMEGKNNGCKA